MHKKIIDYLILSLLVLFSNSCSDNDNNNDDENTETSVVGYWSGEIGYTCSNGEHHVKNGVIVFEEDGAGILLEKGEEPDEFNYELEQENNNIIILFKKGKRIKVKIKEQAKDKLTFTEKCASCGKEVVMQVVRKEPIRSIHVSSTLAYEEIFALHYDEQDRISAIDYKHIDTDGEGDDSEGTVNISYDTNKISVTNALLSDHTLYSIDFTLNNKGWATKAVCSYQNSDNDYSGTGTLNFVYDSNEHLKSISYLYQNSSIDGELTGIVSATWSDNLLLKMAAADSDQTVIDYLDGLVPVLSINLPYFMIYRYDDDIVSCGNDNVVLCYASILNILGKAPQKLMSKIENGNDDWWSKFYFNYVWQDNRLATINEHSNYGGDDVSGEEYDTQINISYY